MDELLDEYNELLREQEAAVIAAIVAILQRQSTRLLQRTYDQLQSGQFRLAVTGTDLSLIDPLAPDQTDEILELFEQLLQGSTSLGLDLSAKLSEPVIDTPVAAAISAATVAAAARRSRGYLERHARSFAAAVAGGVASGLVKGESVAQLTREFESKFNLTKSRAEVIVRTESLRSYNDAVRAFYAQNGVQLVIYYAVPDDRTCPYCAAQAGRVFKLGAIRLPRHPQCRCSLAPYSTNQYETSPKYEAARRSHRNEVLRYAKDRGIQIDEGPAYFEQSQPLPARKDGKSEH